MSQLINRFRDFVGRKDSYPTVYDLQKEKDVMHELLKKATSVYTPAAGAGELWEETPEASVRLPRVPYDLRLFYIIRQESPVLRTVVLKLTEEIFRETLKDGWDLKPKFKVKCQKCKREYNEKVDRCPYCQGSTFPPDPEQKRIWKRYAEKANHSKQSLLTVFFESNLDVETVDDIFILMRKEYIVGGWDGEQMRAGKVNEIMRGDPVTFRIISDRTGKRGGLYYACPLHRMSYAQAPGNCQYKHENDGSICGIELIDVHYVEFERGGTLPTAFYFDDEVIHTSKYEPSRLYGFPPIYTLWVLSRTLNLMDLYVQQAYQKGRLRGILGINAHEEYVTKWWDITQAKLRKDPHYQPVIALEGEEGSKSTKRMEFVKFMDSLSDMQYTPAKEFMRKQIASLYGVSPIFQNDQSTGVGLANEGLQITVTDRAVEFGQAIYHNSIIPQICMAIGVTDWEPRLKPSREIDAMAELQQINQKAQTAQILHNMGFDVKMIEGDDGEIKFEFSEEPTRDPMGGGGFGGGFQGSGNIGNIGNLNNPTKPETEEPDNRQGFKECPPGKISTPENPRCHPLEWEYNKTTKSENIPSYLKVKCRESTFQKELQEANDPNHRLFWTLNKVELVGDQEIAKRLFFETEKGVRGYFNVTKYGVEHYQGKQQPVVYFDRKFIPSQSVEKAVPREFHAKVNNIGQRLSIWNKMNDHALTRVKQYLWKNYGDDLFEKYHQGEQRTIIERVCKRISGGSIKGMEKAQCRGRPPKNRGYTPYYCASEKVEFQFFVDNNDQLWYIGARDDKGKNISKWVTLGNAMTAFGWHGVNIKDGRGKGWSKSGLTTDSQQYYNPKYQRDDEEDCDCKKEKWKKGQPQYFDLHRNEDESGVSGTGTVGSGIVFPDGQVVFRWGSETPSTNIYNSLKEFNAVHVDPHPNNKTEFHWRDIEKQMEKSGDMLAHYACVINKMKKAGYNFPAKRGKKLKDFLDKMRATDPKVKKFHEICNKAGNIGESDPDYPDPPSTKAIEPKEDPIDLNEQIEETFTDSLVSTFEKQFNALENINEKSKKEVEKDLSQIIDRTMSRIQKVAFNEVLSAYREGKESIKDLAKMAPPTATSGGKARMARRLDSIIPEHNIYGESFLGMGSVFLKKEGAQESYLNDADPEVMKIWESLQKGDEKVFSFLAKQEWNGDKSHFEKLKAQDPGQLDDLSRTYRKIYLRRYSNQAKEQGFRSDGKNLGAPQWLKSIDRLQKYTEKLKGVHLSTGDWKDISRKIDGPSTFHFIDPPYTDEFAKELTEFLPSLKGKWLVTFSENKILKDFFKEKVHEIKVKANANFWNVPKDSYRTEYLISNYPMNVPKGSIFKATAPTEIHFTDLPFNRADIKVLEAIYKENPFWTAFSGMNQSISDKLKDIVRDSYLPPDSKKFKTALEEIKEKYPHRNPAIQEELAYMRTGKLSLAQVIREMKKVLKTEVYRLERIARSETAAVTAKGREIEFRKRDDGTNRYDWPGPQDKFTSEECTEIKARVQKEGKGLGVSLDRMLEIHKEVNKKFNAMRKSQWNYRDWLPHANCRHVLRRVV